MLLSINIINICQAKCLQGEKTNEFSLWLTETEIKKLNKQKVSLFLCSANQSKNKCKALIISVKHN